MSELTLMDKLAKIQAELKTPKSNFNEYGNFYYRSLEDIFEGVKPLLSKYDLTLVVTDKPVQVGERYYIEATATLENIYDDETYSVTAYAREQLNKKGMDEAQLTGATSSYARKYALNGLFLIDDTKDVDELQVDTIRNNGELNQMIIQMFEQALKALKIDNNALHKKLGTNKTKLSELVKSDDVEAKQKLIKQLEELTNGTDE